MQPTSPVVPRELVETLREVVCAITRYPAQFVTNEAEFEDELGIDSVKLTEILAALRERYPIDDQVAKELHGLRTIAAIAAHLAGRIRPARPVPPDRARPPERRPATDPAPPPAAPIDPGDSLERQVILLIAEVTRYPEHLLGPELDFEEDLGIDSVKLAEILAALRDRFAGHAVIEQAALPLKQLRTIRQVVAVLVPLLRPPAAAAEPERAPQLPAAAVTRNAERVAAPHLPLAGKTALITNSGHGLGKEIAAHLARLGASVVVNSPDSSEAGEQTAQELREHGGRAIHILGAATDPAETDRLLAQIERAVGELDFLVSSGSSCLFGRQVDVTPEHWERAFRTHVVGLHLLAVRGARLMRRRGGRIVAMSSTAAHRYVEYWGAQGPAAAALESLVRYLAVELAEAGIRVNGVATGPLADDRLSKFPEAERLVPYWTARTPGQRLATPSDVANVVEFLLSDKAQMVNGCIMTVDGGLSLLG